MLLVFEMELLSGKNLIDSMFKCVMFFKLFVLAGLKIPRFMFEGYFP